LRAAQKISSAYNGLLDIDTEEFFLLIEDQLSSILKNIQSGCESSSNDDKFSPIEILDLIKERMKKYAGIIRSNEGLEEEIRNVKLQLINLDNIITLKNPISIIDYFRVKDSLLTQIIFLSAISDYHQHFGPSRGSFLAIRNEKDNKFAERLVELPGKLAKFNYIKSELDLSSQIQTISYRNNKIHIDWVNVREIPEKIGWFESVWKDYNDGKIIQ